SRIGGAEAARAPSELASAIHQPHKGGVRHKPDGRSQDLSRHQSRSPTAAPVPHRHVMSVHPPLSFGKRYVVHEELGHGGRGVVFKATDRLTGSVVALKSLTYAAASVSRQELAILL